MKDFNDVWKDSWVGTTSGDWDIGCWSIGTWWMLSGVVFCSFFCFVSVPRIFFSWMKADIMMTTCRNEYVTSDTRLEMGVGGGS